MKKRQQAEEQAQKLLARAAVFRLLARGFAYPAEGHGHEMQRDFARLYEADRYTRFTPPVALALTRAQQGWRHADGNETSREYMRLFLGSGPVSLHETAYGDGRRIAGRPVELADINGFYAAFGLTLSESDPDLPDHLCTELEFYSLLLVKESYALTRGWLSRARLAREAAKTFLEQHLGRWTEPLRASLQEHNGGLYLDLANAVAATVEAECKRLRVQPLPFIERLPPDVMQDESFVCPRANPQTASH
ncbi:MAG: molecular chaperone TorD family protein [Sulfuricaulis sp.]|uniref:TorD/DmsD family molecular chaperone n=1 Tax=Sulfuricaulis sp. TaxID=2003553 RepID=UPI0025D6BA4B|nr:molecular chaperone TorD family protein [Sulfuricaulis sp.]MCR4346635.1 molecular chaperone TorD family protein [Sulfuricaulis sp.]